MSANAFGMRDEREYDEESKEEKKRKTITKQYGKRTKKSLRKHEGNQYSLSDSDTDPYADVSCHPPSRHSVKGETNNTPLHSQRSQRTRKSSTKRRNKRKRMRRRNSKKKPLRKKKPKRPKKRTKSRRKGSLARRGKRKRREKLPPPLLRCLSLLLSQKGKEK